MAGRSTHSLRASFDSRLFPNKPLSKCKCDSNFLIRIFSSHPFQKNHNSRMVLFLTQRVFVWKVHVLCDAPDGSGQEEPFLDGKVLAVYH